VSGVAFLAACIGVVLAIVLACLILDRILDHLERTIDDQDHWW
jgi:hypothetical protein